MENKATNFEFTSYEFKPETGRVTFNYKTEFEDREPLLWTETIVLPCALGLLDLKDVPKDQLEKILQSLHIVLGISYYKFYCPPKISFSESLAQSDNLQTVRLLLSKTEAEFWNAIYKKGLGEFFYKNNLDPKISPKFPLRHCEEPAGDEAISTAGIAASVAPLLPRNDGEKKGYLVGVSGGKDSIVGVELLKEAGENLTTFYVETNKESELVNNVAKLTGLKQLKLRRILDPKIFEKHQYNGHIPISAIYAFLGVFTAILYGYKGFIVSNEYSSNFGNVKYKGMEVNHQWSKTFEFEKIFSDYVKEFISPDLEYFSLLRPFYEIRIAEMFSHYPKYFSVFSSCNNNFKLRNNLSLRGGSQADEAIQSNGTNPRLPRSPFGLARNDGTGLWCGKCAKCVFAFTILSPFLNKKNLIRIFGKDLRKDKSLKQLFKDISGKGKMKPFDCVGTFQETQTALKIKNYPEVFKTQAQNLVPEKFKFLGMKNALILGYGKEGIVTKKYLQKFYPKLKIGIAENVDKKNYADKQEGFDIAIKTPGINKSLVTVPYTTATNIFFSKVAENNTVIGITGSKGKSTTATLIYEILEQAGKDVEFLGNIGKPMLEYLLEHESAPRHCEEPAGDEAIQSQNTSSRLPRSLRSLTMTTEKIFVLELSSYQLDDIKFSPHISVVTNLFPEHLNYHGNLKNYYEAKKNIMNFQNKNDYFIYNPQNKIMASWLKNYRGKAVPYSASNLKSSLLGGHNKSNIGSAVQVAKILGISDDIIAKAVENFKGLPHRLEFVGEFKKIKFYDDAISTTPESTIEAIKSIPNINTIFLGGEDRGYNFTKLAKEIKKHKIKNIVLFPDSGKKIRAILRHGSGQENFNFFETKSMESAVKFAYKNTEKGGVCLLSCASPSYSLWKDFEEKGDLFKKFVIKFSK